MTATPAERPYPPLRLEQFFPGRSRAFGIFQDRFGRPRRQFQAEVEATYTEGVLTLDERFRFDDGQSEQRTWHIRPEGDGRYLASADGVIGQATGVTDGAFLHWRYRFALDIGTRLLHVRFDDWMCRQSDTVLTSRATVTKWGIRIGDLTMVFIKEPAALAAGRETGRPADAVEGLTGAAFLKETWGDEAGCGSNTLRQPSMESAHRSIRSTTPSAPS